MNKLNFEINEGFLEAIFDNGSIKIHHIGYTSNFALNAFYNGKIIEFENNNYPTIYAALAAANEWYQDAAFDWYIECDGSGPGHFYYRPTPEVCNDWVSIDKATKMTRKKAEADLSSLLCTLGRGKYWLIVRPKEN